MINEGGKLNITAPLGRIHHKIRRMVPPGPYSPDREELSKLTPAALRQRKVPEGLALPSARKTISFLSLIERWLPTCLSIFGAPILAIL